MVGLGRYRAWIWDFGILGFGFWVLDLRLQARPTSTRLDSAEISSILPSEPRSPWLPVTGFGGNQHTHQSSGDGVMFGIGKPSLLRQPHLLRALGKSF